jgi:hypothetical protein
MTPSARCAGSSALAHCVEPSSFVDESRLGLGQPSEVRDRQGVAKQQDGSLLLDSDDHHRGAVGAVMGCCASAVDHGPVEGVPELPHVLFDGHFVPGQPKVLALRPGSGWNKPLVSDVPSHPWFRPDGCVARSSRAPTAANLPSVGFEQRVRLSLGTALIASARTRCDRDEGRERQHDPQLGGPAVPSGNTIHHPMMPVLGGRDGHLGRGGRCSFNAPRPPGAAADEPTSEEWESPTRPIHSGISPGDPGECGSA